MSANAQPNPYAPPKAEVSDASDEQIVEPASRGTRLGAALLDVLVLFAVVLPIFVAMVPALIRAGGDPSALGAAGSSCNRLRQPKAQPTLPTMTTHTSQDHKRRDLAITSSSAT